MSKFRALQIEKWQKHLHFNHWFPKISAYQKSWALNWMWTLQSNIKYNHRSLISDIQPTPTPNLYFENARANYVFGWPYFSKTMSWNAHIFNVAFSVMSIWTMSKPVFIFSRVHFFLRWDFQFCKILALCFFSLCESFRFFTLSVLEIICFVLPKMSGAFAFRLIQFT